MCLSKTKKPKQTLESVQYELEIAAALSTNLPWRCLYLVALVCTWYLAYLKEPWNDSSGGFHAPNKFNHAEQT